MATPVVFIHGLWLHATSWRDWGDLFHESGYDPIAPEWPGGSPTVAEARTRPDAVAGHGLTAIADHYAQIIASLDRRPVVIGHAFGGLVAQKLISRGITAAGVAIDAAPIRGALALPPSALRVAAVALRNPANRGRALSLTPAQFRYGFGNAVPAAESAELYERWSIPSPARPVFEVAFAGLSPRSPAAVDTRKATRGPLLLVAGGKDHAVPPAVTRRTYRRYRRSAAVTELLEFPDRGHSLTIDSGWREVAGAALDWLKKHAIV